MKNIKLTLATTLSVLVMTFAGSAFASDWESNKRYQNQKNKVAHKSASKKKVIIARAIKKPARIRYVGTNTNKRTEKYNQIVNDRNNRINRQNRSNHQNYRVPQHVYSVRSGDTLSHVSLRTGISVNNLKKFNRLDSRGSNSLRIGQVLRLSLSF